MRAGSTVEGRRLKPKSFSPTRSVPFRITIHLSPSLFLAMCHVHQEKRLVLDGPPLLQMLLLQRSRLHVHMGYRPYTHACYSRHSHARPHLQQLTPPPLQRRPSHWCSFQQKCSCRHRSFLSRIGPDQAVSYRNPSTPRTLRPQTSGTCVICHCNLATPYPRFISVPSTLRALNRFSLPL